MRNINARPSTDGLACVMGRGPIFIDMKRLTQTRIPRLVALAWLSPALAVVWGALRALRQPGRRKDKVLALSVFGNLLFVIVLLLGYLASRYDDQVHRPEGGGAQIVVPPDLVHRARGPLEFCEAHPGSERAVRYPNAIYAASLGLIRARFEFADEQMGVLREVTIADKLGRPWIDASLDDGKVIWHRYAGEHDLESEISLMDENGDGIPDVMINWKTRETYRPEHEVPWQRVATSDDTTLQREGPP